MPLRCEPLHCVCGRKIPMRIVVSTFCVFGIIVSYGQRQCLPLAITRMVPPSTKNYSNECPRTNESLYGEHIEGGYFAWSEAVQGYILASFFMGYLFGQLPGGIAGDLISGTYTYLIGMMLSTVLTLVFPVMVWYLPWHFLCAGRALIGIVQGVSYPCTGVLLAHWVPPFERATLGAFSFAANSLGTALGNLLSGIWMNYTRYWPSAFYFWGATGVFWSVSVYIWVHDKPSDHPYVSRSEIDFLKKEVIARVKFKVPWKRIFSDFGVWSLIIGEIGHDFTLYFIMTSMPKYFSDVLYMSVRSIALSTSLPFVGLWLASIANGKICDYGLEHKNWDILWSRRVFTFLGFFLPSTALVIMVYVECSVPLAVTCFAFACTSKSPHYSGLRVNHMDITINFAGIVISMVNTMGCVSGFVCPIIISHVAPNNRISEWKNVMWIIFGCAGVPTVFYFFTSRAKRAEWDIPKENLEEFRKHVRMEEERKKHKKELKEAEKKEKKERKLRGEEVQEATTSNG